MFFTQFRRKRQILTFFDLKIYLQSTHAHLFLQGDDKLYINQGESLRKVYHNGKSFPLDPNLMDSNLYSSSSKQGNLFSQSYNICMDSYMSGEFISVPNEGSEYFVSFKFISNQSHLKFPFLLFLRLINEFR